MRTTTDPAADTRITALRHTVGCGDGRRDQELCAAIDDLVAFAPDHYAVAAIEYVV